MKKINLSIPYDEERVKALNLYLGQKDGSMEEELLKAVEALYLKTVPANVREFLDLRSGAPSPPPKKKPRPSPSVVVTDTIEPGEGGGGTNTDQPSSHCQRPLAAGGEGD